MDFAEELDAHDLLALMWAPFLMCLVLTGIHAYLGLHVIAREVVFVDIALAQIAALGATDPVVQSGRRKLSSILFS